MEWADNPVPELGNRTPLQGCQKGCLDQLARKGIVGSVVNCPEGLPPGRQTPQFCPFSATIPGSAIPPRSPGGGRHRYPTQARRRGYRCTWWPWKRGISPLLRRRSSPTPADHRRRGVHCAGQRSLCPIRTFRNGQKMAGDDCPSGPFVSPYRSPVKVDITGIKLIPPP